MIPYLIALSQIALLVWVIRKTPQPQELDLSPDARRKTRRHAGYAGTDTTEEGMSWQPIETAPKTSRHILGFGNGCAIEQCCYIMSWGESWPDGDEAWILFGSVQASISPTHWMPLPKPPQETP